MRGRNERGEKEMIGERGGWDPQGLVHVSMYEILKNALIAELILLLGAAAQTFAPGGKHPRAATDDVEKYSTTMKKKRRIFGEIVPNVATEMRKSSK